MTDQDIKLERLIISRNRYGNNPGDYEGTIDFSSGLGKFELKLTQELSQRIIAACSEEIVAVAQLQATKMNESVARQILGKALEHDSAS